MKMKMIIVNQWTIHKKASQKLIDDSSKKQNRFASKSKTSSKDELLLQQYIKEMNKLSKGVPKCFIDCYYFSKWNKTFFLILLASQTIQSMFFNTVLDLPQLFMILLYLPFFVFRKKMFVEYQFYTLFFASYCAVFVYIKLLYTILIHTQSVDDWYK